MLRAIQPQEIRNRVQNDKHMGFSCFAQTPSGEAAKVTAEQSWLNVH